MTGAWTRLETGDRKEWKDLSGNYKVRTDKILCLIVDES